MTINKQLDSFYEIAYSILNALYNADLPIVFKGMLVTRLALKENKIDFSRQTRDIDGDWIGEKLTLNELESEINKALKGFPLCYVKAYRDYNEHTSAGFELYIEDKKYCTFDLSIRQNNYKKLYDLEGTKFYGQTIDKILADKIVVLSSRKIFRRSKDLIDLYYLYNIGNINKDIILKILKDSNRELESFGPLINQRNEIQHAYETMTWIEDKPPFDDVYETCIKISNIFI